MVVSGQREWLTRTATTSVLRPGCRLQGVLVGFARTHHVDAPRLAVTSWLERRRIFVRLHPTVRATTRIRRQRRELQRKTASGCAVIMAQPSTQRTRSSPLKDCANGKYVQKPTRARAFFVTSRCPVQPSRSRKIT